MLALQRKLTGDRNKWRTVARFENRKKTHIIQICQALSKIVEPISWRIVEDTVYQTVIYEFS